MGAAVKLIHLHHPVDVAINAAVTDHLLGEGRFIFGFGTGFASPLFSNERGLSFEDRQARMMECLEMVRRCWSEHEPFDLDGRFWQGRGIVALPKPVDHAAMPIAVASSAEPMIQLAAERGYILLSSFVESAAAIRRKGEIYTAHAREAGRPDPLECMTVARAIYVADSREAAIEDLREAVAFEVGIQAKRGFLAHLKKTFGLDVPDDETAIDHLVGAGIYIVGDADHVTKEILAFQARIGLPVAGLQVLCGANERTHRADRDVVAASGGFGTLLLVVGKDWASREKRFRSMRLFMELVAPAIRFALGARGQAS